ncbi:MAG: hypothetical protein AAF518_05730 [Spirochaetota bacterium]
MEDNKLSQKLGLEGLQEAKKDAEDFLQDTEEAWDAWKKQNNKLRNWIG